jgi:hypothetical protein
MRGFAIAETLAVALMALGATTHAQTVGPGASPGRAAYRPNAQWNNGPFYTTPHWNPYSPHPTSSTNLYFAEPLLPPWTNGPHGLYSTFYPGQGTVYPYAEGFSPYSGFSSWYVRSYNVDATREVVQQARTLFFRSAPRPPDGVLPPLPPPRIVPAFRSTPLLANGSSLKGDVPGQPPIGPPQAMIPIYRSSVPGLP